MRKLVQEVNFVVKAMSQRDYLLYGDYQFFNVNHETPIEKNNGEI